MVRQLLSTTNQPTTNSNVFSTVFDHWKDYDIDTRWKICGVRLPRFPRFRYLGIYVSGGLFALGWWAFIDAIIYAKITQISHSIIVQDWISGVLSTLGMIIQTSSIYGIRFNGEWCMLVRDQFCIELSTPKNAYANLVFWINDADSEFGYHAKQNGRKKGRKEEKMDFLCDYFLMNPFAFTQKNACQIFDTDS
ncbi:hypothetical protein G9A89_007687 [Geosiphon pyriformis]|nr:hypothetical protein G9A89_007687 [Geosiphon pyriformis]